MNLRYFATLSVWLPALASMACSGSDPQPTGSGDPQDVTAARKKPKTPTTDPGTPPGTEPTFDHGAPSRTFPAFRPDMVQIVSNGGLILADPKIVTITYDADPNAALLESFGDRIGQTTYWREAVGEYGVGPAVSGPHRHVRIQEAPPSTLTDTALEKLIADRVTNSGTSGWPAWTADSIYIVYVPEKTVLTDARKGTDACKDYNGFHSEVSSAGKSIVYAVVDQSCHDQPSNTPDTEKLEEYATWVASHELGEAATDPHPNTDTGLTGFDDAHRAWELFQTHQSENGDACEFFEDSFYRESEVSFGFKVQRLWSNASAAAGHNPCVPLDKKAYFNVSPLNLEDIQVLVSTNKLATTRGIHVPVGQTRQVDLGLFSDAPTGAWDLTVSEGDGSSTPRTRRVDVSLDRTSGQNGEKAVLTVHTRSAGAKRGTLVTVVSKLGDGAPKFMPILVQTN